MAKRKGRGYPKLGLTLLKYFVFALLGAGVTTIALGGLAYLTINEVTVEASKQDTLKKSVGEFQAFVTKNKVYSTDTGTIRKWNQKNYLIDFILHDEVVLYSTEDKQDSQRYQPYEESAENARFPRFSIEFRDKVCTMTVVKYYHMPFQAVWGILFYIVPFISFVVIFSIFLQKKIRYIHALEEGIHIIEGGGLEYRIPIEGKDELTSLAQSINTMSEAMGERIRAEELEKKIENDLIASISHDIRTPLTTAICYLDLVHDKKFDAPGQAERYVENAREKVHHLKYLTDNLFEHSVHSASSSEQERTVVNGAELLAQLFSELRFLLEDKGFTVLEDTELEREFQLKVNVSQIRRVFDNLASNVIKYARAETPVRLEAYLKKGVLVVCQKNAMRQNDGNHESFGIGMQNCVRILKAHRGSMEAGCRGSTYQIILRLPLLEDE